MLSTVLASFLTALASGAAGLVIRAIEKRQLRKKNKLID